jgi:hypothetical protein
MGTNLDDVFGVENVGLIERLLLGGSGVIEGDKSKATGLFVKMV